MTCGDAYSDDESFPMRSYELVRTDLTQSWSASYGQNVFPCGIFGRGRIDVDKQNEALTERWLLAIKPGVQGETLTD